MSCNLPTEIIDPQPTEIIDPHNEIIEIITLLFVMHLTIIHIWTPLMGLDPSSASKKYALSTERRGGH